MSKKTHSPRSSKAVRVTTVGELRAALAKYADSRKVHVNFADCHSSVEVYVRLHRGWTHVWVEIVGV